MSLEVASTKVFFIQLLQFLPEFLHLRITPFEISSGALPGVHPDVPCRIPPGVPCSIPSGFSLVETDHEFFFLGILKEFFFLLMKFLEGLFPGFLQKFSIRTSPRVSSLEDIPGAIPERIPGRISEEIPDRISVLIPGELSRGIPAQISEEYLQESLNEFLDKSKEVFLEESVRGIPRGILELLKKYRVNCRRNLRRNFKSNPGRSS